MFYAFSGGVGTGKTLHAVKTLIEKDEFVGRQIYYHGVRVLLLDFSVCNSFQGWFYGIYFPANKANKALERKVLRIEDEGRLAEIDDFPYLQYQYSQHKPVEQWLYWYKKTASKKRLKQLQEALDVLEMEESEIEAHHIEEMGLSWKSFDNPLEIHKLPAGSVIFVDEVQNIWAPRAGGSKPTDALKWMTKSRHGGSDLVFVSQDFRDVDQIIRRRIQSHVHLEFIGGNALHRYEHIEGIETPADLAKAEKKKIVRDSNFYGVYLSAIKHTQNPKLDPQIKKGITMLAFCAIGFMACAYGFYDFYQGQFSDVSGAPVEVESQHIDERSEPIHLDVTSSPIGYITRFLPSEESLPFSAPAYDHLTSEAIEYPTLTCVVSDSDCSCFTQQMSQYAISESHCINIARYGYFDPFTETNDSDSRKRDRRTQTNNGLQKGGIF
ncbi:zonular occludens toxin domain-containing protein [Vibrio parahaemolyticus]